MKYFKNKNTSNNHCFKPNKVKLERSFSHKVCGRYSAPKKTAETYKEIYKVKRAQSIT